MPAPPRAKLNTRFVLIIVLAFGAALALLGGVYVLKLRGDATRNYRKGNDAYSRGDYKSALDQFGRALNKDPGNADYLEHVRDALLKIVPETAGEAREYYSRYLGVLGHAALHNASDPEAHLQVLRTTYSAARRLGDARPYQMLLAGADNMLQHVRDSDPKKPIGKVYRGIAITHLASQQSDDAILRALEDLDKAAAALPHDDLACSAEIVGRLAWINKMEVSGKSRAAIEAQRDALAAAAQSAIERAADGPETARAYLLYLMFRKTQNDALGGGAATGARNSGAPELGTPEQITPEQIRAAAEHAASTITPADDPGLVAETASLLELLPSSPAEAGSGRRMAAALIERQLASNPQTYDLRLAVARLQYHLDDLDLSERSIRQVLDAKQLPVCFLSQLQFDLRRQAAGLLGDVEYRRLEKAPEANKAVALEKLKAARTLVAGMVTDPSQDLLLLRADGKIAYITGQFADAAQKFEKLVRDTDSRDPEMLAFAAASLERIGQIGLAHERIARASASNPGFVPWIVERAALELQMGLVEQATATIRDIPDAALADPRTADVVAAVRRGAAGGAEAVKGGGDPIQTALAAAQESLNKNEVDNARAALLASLQEHQDSTLLLQALAQVEIRAGNRDAAHDYVERGLKIQPNDQILNRLSAGLRFDDPIQATFEYLKTMISEPNRRLEAAMTSMANLMVQQQQRAAQLSGSGDAANAGKARDLADRAQAEADKAAADLAKLEPDNPALLEFQFSRAIQAKDWSKAGEVVANAKRLNLDKAGGKFYEGRLELIRGNYRPAVAALEAASDRLSFSSQVWRALAFAYQNSGNFASAERAYEQAYRCNPNDIVGARAYLTLLQIRGDKTRALQILQTVHRLAPADVALHEAWLDLEAEVGDKSAALAQRLALYASTPSERDNAASLAMLLASLEPSPQTILDERGQPVFGEQRWASMSPGDQEDARREAREKYLALSNKIIDGLAASMGDDLRVAVLRAAVLRERGAPSEGEQVLRDFIARREKPQQTEDMYVELSRYQARISHYTDAVESLQQAVALAGPRQREATHDLGILLMQLNRNEDAIAALQSVLAKQDDQNVRLQIVECLINLKRFDEAEQRLNEASSGAGGSVSTLLAANIARGRARDLTEKGNLSGADKLFAQQRDLLSKAEQQDPTNPTPRMLLAESLLEEYNRTRRVTLLDDALAALDRAEHIRAGTSEVSALRVQVLKAKGDTRSAIAELQRAVQIAPDNITPRRDLVQLLLDSGDSAGARQAVDSAIRQNPTLAVWHEVRGTLILTMHGDFAEALASLTRAYELAPSSNMLLKLVETMLLPNPPDCRGAADRLAAHTAEMPNEPPLRETYARVLICLGKRDEAIDQLRQAYARRKEMLKQGTMKPAEINSWFAAVMRVYPPDQVAEADKLVRELAEGNLSVQETAALARIWGRAGPVDLANPKESETQALNQALALQQQAVTLCPPEDTDLRVELNTYLGTLLLNARDMRRAAEAYEVVLRLRPTDINALNNLTYLKAEEFNDAAGALPLAERLAQLSTPKANYASREERFSAAGVQDTVGWVYYKNGDLEKAKARLNESVTTLPQADTYVHLAEVLLKSGDKPGAEKQLIEAEKLNPSGRTTKKIKSLRDDIGNGRAAGQ